MSYKSSMKMISPGFKVESGGETNQILHVLFTDTEGNEVRYRWGELKKDVLEWIKVEKNEQKEKQAVFDGAGIFIENDWDVTPYGEKSGSR